MKMKLLSLLSNLPTDRFAIAGGGRGDVRECDNSFNFNALQKMKVAIKNGLAFKVFFCFLATLVLATSMSRPAQAQDVAVRYYIMLLNLALKLRLTM